MMQTRTFAEILAKQGEFDEAAAIYRVLCAKDPGAAGLAQRLAELERLANTNVRPPDSEPVRRLKALLERIGSRQRSS